MSVKERFLKRFSSQEGERASGRIRKQKTRKQHLTELRKWLSSRADGDGLLDIIQFSKTVCDPKFIESFFSLADTKEFGYLTQAGFFEKLTHWASKAHDEEENNERLILVDLMESVTYLVCDDKSIFLQDFQKVICTKGVSRKWFRILGSRKSKCSVDSLMAFVSDTTCSREIDSTTLENLQRAFITNFGKEKKDIDFEDFKKVIPCKDDFFVKRIFELFDLDKSGKISCGEFCETIHEFSLEDDNTKVAFLFHIYDVNDDGKLYKENFEAVIKAALKESGLKFDEAKTSRLSTVLFEDGVKTEKDFMTLDDFKNQLGRQDGLIKNLALLLNKWLLPEDSGKQRNNPQKSSKYFTKVYWAKNRKFLITVLTIFAIMAVITLERLIYFSSMSMLSGFTPNLFYMVSRAAGKNILFLSIVIIMFVLRNSITFLRNKGLGRYLPLDNNIYLHKIIGVLIFVIGMIHSLCHFSNFAINIQPDPVKYLQMTYSYWEAHWGVDNVFNQYNPPEHCHIVSGPENMSRCNPDSLTVPEGVHSDIMFNNGNFTHCEVCEEGYEGYSYTQWMLSFHPGLFGLMGGVANPAGIGLFLVMIIIFVFSLPFVRRTGHFELFFFTHYLYVVYFILLIFHAPEFWKWFLPIGILWIGEKMYRTIQMFMGSGRASILEGIVLPSKVTNLVIKRPKGFKFNPGDWVFINIPRVSTSEWHPFTISSAPEVTDRFTLHIRGVGSWTQRLYSLFEEEYKRQNDTRENLRRRSPSFMLKIKKTVRKNFRALHETIKETYANENVLDSDDEDNFKEALQEHRKDDLEKRKLERMKRRETKLSVIHNVWLNEQNGNHLETPKEPGKDQENPVHLKSFRTHTSIEGAKSVKYRPISSSSSDSFSSFESEVSVKDEDKNAVVEDDVEKSSKAAVQFLEPMEVYIDGPFGSPSSNFYRAEHAVLIGTGIGITPFASILQSIMCRYWRYKKTCPNCNFKWTDEDELDGLFNLKKVDFFWINRDHTSFEWFVDLLSQLETEQQELGGSISRFLDMHLYVTSMLQKTDMKAVALQMALDMLHKKEEKDLVTGLKSRINAGRPNWNKVFTKLQEEKKGKVTVFYCGNPMLAKTLRKKCAEFGFGFRKEVF